MTTSSRTQILPLHVALLGYGGLLPFVFLALAVWLLDDSGANWFAWLLAYGAVIVSFVGALHWGFAMTLSELSERERYQRFVCSVLPALLGFLALLVQGWLGALILIFAFVWAYWQDLSLVTKAALPAWYLPMRLHLSLIASLSLLAGLIGRFL